MPKNKPTPPAATVFAWLRQQLGPRALAPLTSTDEIALQAAVQVASLWVWTGGDDRQLADAFGKCVLQIQPHCLEFAYHAIAHVADWSSRRQLWEMSGIQWPSTIRRCKYE